MNKSDKTVDVTPKNSKESFAALLEEEPISSRKLAGTVVKGTIVKIENDFAVIDVGLKSEGLVDLKEFGAAEVKPEDQVDVYVERMENKDGQIVLSREKARREESWVELEKAFQDNERVNGVIVGRVKGGLTVDLNGALAFLPGSQVDIRPIRDVNPLMNIEQPFQILKMDRLRGNIVVSRRAILEESMAATRSEIISKIKEGDVVDGIVKNITDYGAFVDLGGIDGLLHVTDMSWSRINHPSEILEVGQNIKVQIIRFNPDTQRISLGLKQLEEDPWTNIAAKYPVESKLEGTITNVTEYGAFIELEEGVEGLAHVSDMSWTKKNVHPNQLVSSGQKIPVMVLSLDPEKRRIALGIKQCTDNPWEQLQEKLEVGTKIEGEIKNITEFGLFIGLDEQIDGMVHMSDLSWEHSGDVAIKEYSMGQMVKAKVLDIDPEKERIVLGIKQLTTNPFEAGLESLERNKTITCAITSVQEGGIEVKTSTGVPAFIRKADLAKERADRRPDRFDVGEKVDAKIISIDREHHKITLSIKAREIEEENAVRAEYGSTDRGASLGDILGVAMSEAQERQKQEKESAAAEKKPAKKPAAKPKATKKAAADAEDDATKD